ncbi:MAG: sugar transferase [Gammaproteobacteria bacterium]|nr:MAG: sugar transferase [Gammaproteobacteria bacterium]
MKRIFDLILGIIIAGILFLPMVLIAFAVKVTSKGPVLYWSDRVGLDNVIFKMPKFRSMVIGTPAVATHLLDRPESALTPIGGFIRKTSLDELPQLWCVIRGQMSFVGPRPALYNQEDLISLRTKKGVHRFLPGITGWAQVNGRDELPIEIKVDYDAEYALNYGFLLDMKILWTTFIKVLKHDGVSH